MTTEPMTYTTSSKNEIRFHGCGNANPVEFQILACLYEWSQRQRLYWFKSSHPRFRSMNRESVRNALLKLEKLGVLRSKRVGVLKLFRIAPGAYIGKA